MFVVNTTSATAGGTGESRRPRKRVPSSRRRNPGTERGLLTGRRYCFGCGVGAGDAGAVVSARGASSGTAELGFWVVGAAGAAGAVSGASSTEAGTRVRADAIWSTNARNRKMPPHHQLARVSRFLA